MSLVVLLSLAHALDCAGLDPDSCAAANVVAAQINATTGAQTIRDTGVPGRLRTRALYDAFESIRTETGCEIDVGSLTGTIGGRYGHSTFDGAWGDLPPGTEAGTIAGTVDRASRTFTGTYVGGTEAGAVGSGLSTYNSDGQLVGSRADGFLLGRWIRTSGSSGVYATLYGDCGTDAIDDWYDGDLPLPPDPTPQHPTCPTCTVWVVDDDATGTGDGRTWGNAFTHPRAALAVAQPGDVVWIAQGTYGGEGVPFTEFLLDIPDGVGLYGGFAGGETEISERPRAFVGTRITGDRAGDDDSGAIRQDNLRTLVRMGHGTTLDGLLLTATHQNIAPPDGCTLVCAEGDGVVLRDVTATRSFAGAAAIALRGANARAERLALDGVADAALEVSGSATVVDSSVQSFGVGIRVTGDAVVVGSTVSARRAGLAVDGGTLEVANSVAVSELALGWEALNGGLLVAEHSASSTALPVGVGNVHLDGSTAALDPTGIVRLPSGVLLVDPGSALEDAGSTAVADATVPDWRTGTIRTDGAADGGDVDLGAHQPVDGVWIDHIEGGPGSLTWTSTGTRCSLTNGTRRIDDLPGSGVRYELQGGGWALTCSGPGGVARANGTVRGVLRVDGRASGLGDGSTWADAFTRIEDAAAAGGWSEIWVAEGTFVAPDGDTWITVDDGRGLYGGFRGDEVRLEERHGGLTVLDADRGRDDALGRFDDNGVRLIETTDDDAVVDGFVLAASHADEALWIGGAGVVVRNVRLTANGGNGIEVRGADATLEGILAWEDDLRSATVDTSRIVVGATGAVLRGSTLDCYEHCVRVTSGDVTVERSSVRSRIRVAAFGAIELVDSVVYGTHTASTTSGVVGMGSAAAEPLPGAGNVTLLSDPFVALASGELLVDGSLGDTGAPVTSAPWITGLVTDREAGTVTWTSDADACRVEQGDLVFDGLPASGSLALRGHARLFCTASGQEALAPFRVPRVLRVDASASGSGDGTSWADAFVHPSDAVPEALRGDEVWVAAGLYVHRGGSRMFEVQNGVAVYGGFAGTEASRASRAALYAATVLSGDVDGDDPTGRRVDNRALVDIADEIVFDGFTLFDGRGTAGAAIVGTPLQSAMRNLTVFGSRQGPAIVLAHPSGTPIERVRFHDNRGGDLLSQYGVLELTDATFDCAAPCVRALDGTELSFVGVSMRAAVLFDPGTNVPVAFANSVLVGDPGSVDVDAVGSAATFDLGAGNVFLDGTLPELVDPFDFLPSGELFQDTGSACVDAGDDAIADASMPDWASRTTWIDGTPDAGPVDPGAHYDPDAVLIHDASRSVSGTVTWTSTGTACWVVQGHAVIGGLPGSGSTAITGPGLLVCDDGTSAAAALF